MTSRRSRFVADFAVDIRQLREAVGLTVPDAAMMIAEHPTLLQSQEQGGSNESMEIRDKCMRRYIAYAQSRIDRRDLPRMTSDSGTTTIYRFRMGLGLDIRQVSQILKADPAWVEDVESGARAFPDHVRAVVWVSYATWAARNLRRLQRAEASMHLVEVDDTPARLELTSNEVAEAQRLAYVGRLTPREAEVEARRLLDLDG